MTDLYQMESDAKDYFLIPENSVCDGATACCDCGINSGDCHCGDCGTCGAMVKVYVTVRKK